MSEAVTTLPGAVARLSRVPSTVGADVARVSDALQEAIACLSEMWMWQRDVPEMLPEGLGDRVRALLQDAGVNLP